MALDLDDLLPDIYTQVPNCPEPFALRCLRDAAREFCQSTLIWRANDQFTVSTPDSEGLTTIDDAAIIRIEWADLDGQQLEPVTVAWLDEHQPGWESADASTPGRWVTQLGPNRVTIIPKATGLLKLRVILMPSRDAMTVPDILVEQYATVIGRGAAGYALTSNSEFANPQLGAALITEFKQSIAELKSTINRGQQRAPIRSKARFL